MIELKEIVRFLDAELRIGEVPDYPGALNGLQLENDGRVTKVAAAVDASLPVFEKAIAAGADLLIVHHGMFWHGARRVVDSQYEKLKLAMNANMSVYSAHIPLDIHHEWGNNVLLCEKIGMQDTEKFHPWKGELLGLKEEMDLSLDELVKRAASVWYNECTSDDFKDAFTGHPKIGDVSSLIEKFAHTTDWAENEQEKVNDANYETIEALAKANTAYEEKFRYIFIVSASGKSAEEMLAIINTRLEHNPEDEIYVAMNEQHKITVIRLVKVIENLSEKADLSSHITTHALDTSIGVPAKYMQITLKGLRNNQWKPMSVGITNADGRISDVLPAGRLLIPGIYTMSFNTGNYYKVNNQNGFYPEVSIQFEVLDNSHYHIPLLINPFGYSTYRGS